MSLQGMTESVGDEAELFRLSAAERRRAPGPRVWAGLALLLAGLALIAIGGCFLIGVLEFHRMRGTAGGPGDSLEGFFLVNLYMLAYANFLGAVLLLLLGARGLLKLMREASTPPAA